MSGFLGLIVGGGGGGTSPVTPSQYISMSGSNAGNRWKVYNWDSSSGIGSSFTSPVVSQIIRTNAFVSDNSNISIALSIPPWVNVWAWSSLGFGTKYADPSSLLNPNGNGMASYVWTNNVDALLTINYDNATGFPQAWAWSASSGFGTKYSNGSVLGFAEGISLNGDNTQVAINSISTIPFIHLYPWSSSTGFGTRFANPSFSPNPQATAGWQKVSFNKVTNDLAVSATSAYIWACRVTSAGFGTAYSSPATSLSSQTQNLLFSPDGASIATVNIGSPSINAYSWGAGFGTKYSTPAGLTMPNQIALDWASTTNGIASGSPSYSPYVDVYSWSSSGFGAKYTLPSGTPPSVSSVSFSNKSR